MTFRQSIGATLLLLTLAACNAPTSAPSVQRDPAAELAAFKAAIRVKYDMKEQAFRDNDPEPIITRFYSDSAISTDNEGKTKIGRDELRPVYEEVIGAFVEIESFESFVNGDAGWDWVNFHVSFPAEANMEPFTFKMLFLWENIAGEWWSHGEMYVLGEFDI
ncbi:MAG: nuclear transport factor 2 family protein [Gammaproteobacteria bacterium]|nr:nuclear transport factor 2 family protein [Gammaproteobacteria bacterium]